MSCLKIIGADLTVSSGGAKTLTLASRLPLGVFTTAATLTFKNPLLRFMVVPDTIKNTLVADEIYPSMSFEFSEVST